MPEIHFRFGGSTAGRTLQCPAWLEITDRLPKKVYGSSPDADRGTLLHNCMEDLIRDPELEAKDCLGRELNGQVVDEDAIFSAIIPALNAYIDMAEEHNITLELPEVQVKADKDIGGTADIICANEDSVFIVDWKFGYHPVEAAENPQGLFYAMCAMQDKRTAKLFKHRPNVYIVIIQPTRDNPLSIWKTSTKRVCEFAVAYETAVSNQNVDNPVTGNYCKFCPAMALCPAKNGEARRAMMLDPKSKDAEVLAEALDLADDVIEWANSVKKMAHEQAELGLHINGFKLVDKRATRKWTDETEVLNLVRKARLLKLEDATDSKLKSPAQLEKICKQKSVDFKRYAAYIESVSSGTTLTRADDPRPEAVNLASFKAAILASE